MSGIIRYILSKFPNSKNIADELSQDAIAGCNPEEERESAPVEKSEGD